MKQARTSSGFTLIEVLLSVSIITILVGASMPVYQSFLTRTDLDITAEAIAGALRRAQTYSRGMNYDQQWGVEVQTGVVTLFRGSSFAGRNTAFDETTVIPPSISRSGLTEVLFAKLTGAPNTTGNITLTTTNDTRTVSINAEGMVNY